MTKGEKLTAIYNKLVDLKESTDTEGAHGDADDLLLEALRVMAEGTGHKENAEWIARAYAAIDKWYS